MSYLSYAIKHQFKKGLRQNIIDLYKSILNWNEIKKSYNSIPYGIKNTADDIYKTYKKMKVGLISPQLFKQYRKDILNKGWKDLKNNSKLLTGAVGKGIEGAILANCIDLGIQYGSLLGLYSLYKKSKLASYMINKQSSMVSNIKDIIGVLGRKWLSFTTGGTVRAVKNYKDALRILKQQLPLLKAKSHVFASTDMSQLLKRLKIKDIINQTNNLKLNVNKARSLIIGSATSGVLATSGQLFTLSKIIDGLKQRKVNNDFSSLITDLSNRITSLLNNTIDAKWNKLLNSINSSLKYK